MIDRQLEAVKLAAQLTLHVGRRSRTAHGLQVVAALGLDRHQSGHALYVLAAELGRKGGVVAMAGPRWTIASAHGPGLAGVLATSLFVRLHDHWALGMETSWTRGTHVDALHLMPQLHAPLGAHAKLQLGLGAHRDGMLGGWGAVAGLRLVVER